jgi:hypothetical protein
VHSDGRKKLLVMGWFSFTNGHATAGDLLSRDLVCGWLDAAGYAHDIACAAPFDDGIDWTRTSPEDYAKVIFVCGPFQDGELERSVRSHFKDTPLIGVNLSMVLPLEDYNPFHTLFERDSTRDARADIVFATEAPRVPVVGCCLVEPYDGGDTDTTDAAIARLLANQHVAVVHIDTRLDTNSVGLRSMAEIESLIARMDVLVTTRLHGLVMALKNGVPAVAIDPERGGFKITRQAASAGWPAVLAVDELTDERLEKEFAYCLTETARDKAFECAARARQAVNDVHQGLLEALE